MDDFLKLYAATEPLLTLIVGAVIGIVASRAQHTRERKAARVEALRSAYGDWVAACEEALTTLNVSCHLAHSIGNLAAQKVTPAQWFTDDYRRATERHAEAVSRCLSATGRLLVRETLEGFVSRATVIARAIASNTWDSKLGSSPGTAMLYEPFQHKLREFTADVAREHPVLSRR
ncbi:MAG: hypothetical protein ACKVU4_05465 [Phycisphaerales bacterium]